jgi:hypothetical protein
MKKIILSLILLALTSPSFASAGSLIHLILRKASREILIADKMLTMTAIKVEKDMFAAILGLSGKESPTPEEFLDVVRTLKVQDSEDLILQNELIVLLSKEDPTADDIIQAKSSMLILAKNLKKLDKSMLISCSGACPTAGIRLKEVTNAVVVDIADSVPVDRKSLRNKINSGMRRLRLGRLNEKVLGSADMHNFAIFLELSKKSSKASSAQREMIAAMVNFSTAKGKTELLSEDNPHFFFRELVTGNYSENELKSFAALLNQAAKESESLPGRQKAFYDILESKIGSSKKRRDALTDLRAQNCFFKKL